MRGVAHGRLLVRPLAPEIVQRSGESADAGLAGAATGRAWTATRARGSFRARRIRPLWTPVYLTILGVWVSTMWNSVCTVPAVEIASTVWSTMLGSRLCTWTGKV